MNSQNEEHPDYGDDTSEPEQTRRRPGRKRLSEESEASDPRQRRRAQNREAQRAFRERRQQHVRRLEAHIKEITEKHAKAEREMQGELRQLQLTVQALETENRLLRNSLNRGTGGMWLGGNSEERYQTPANAVGSRGGRSILAAIAHEPELRASLTKESATQERVQVSSKPDDEEFNSYTEIEGQSKFNHPPPATNSIRDSEKTGHSFMDYNMSDYSFLSPAITATASRCDGLMFNSLPNGRKRIHEDDTKKRVKIWKKITEHPRFEEFDIDSLSAKLRDREDTLISELGDVNEEKLTKFLDQDFMSCI